MFPTSDIETRLRSAIADLLNSVPKAKRKSSFEEMSQIYRFSESKRLNSSTDAHFLAYLATRMPATFAVVRRVLLEYQELTNEAPKTTLDLGAGPGTASLAALDVFHISSMEMFELQPRFQQIASKLALTLDSQSFSHAKWHVEALSHDTELPVTDLAIASYSLSEMPLSLAVSLAAQAFARSKLALVIIEPGTPKGFERIRLLRDHLIGIGAQILAPCSHQQACPLAEFDFCHFKERLTREDFHRETKNASLPYEDEKYSYLIASKAPLTSSFARIVRRPMKGSGHVTLDVCQDGIIKRRVVAKSNKSFYKTAKKLEWGDRLIEP